MSGRRFAIHCFQIAIENWKGHLERATRLERVGIPTSRDSGRPSVNLSAPHSKVLARPLRSEPPAVAGGPIVNLSTPHPKALARPLPQAVLTRGRSDLDLPK